MKYLLGLLFFIATLNLSYSQVGINTDTPDASAELDVVSINNNRGILIPRLTTTQRGTITTPATGLLIYNETTNEYQYFDGVVWHSIGAASNIGKSVKYKNSDITTDLNDIDELTLPIFGNEEWNDNPSLYDVTGNVVTISEAGKYKVLVNVYMEHDSGSRIAPQMYITLNETDDTPIGSIASTGYLRNSQGHKSSSLHLNEIIEVSANTKLEIRIIRNAETGVANMTAGTSNIYIEKIK